MDGLKICTRCRAISARRRRRISSSLLPENIGPTTTSIQPMLPLTMSTQRLLERPNPKSSATRVAATFSACPDEGRGAHFNGRSSGRPLQTFPRSLCRRLVHLSIVERREGGNHCQAKRLLARDQIFGQHASGALAVADADRTGVAINRYGKFGAAGQDFFRQRFRDFDAARAAEMPALAIGDVGPTFKKDSPSTIFDSNIQAAFESYTIVGAIAGVGQHFVQSFRSLACSLHQFFAGSRRVADAALNFVALNFKRDLRTKFEI